MSRRNRHGPHLPTGESAPAGRTAIPFAPVSERPAVDGRPVAPRGDEEPGRAGHARLVEAPAVAPTMAPAAVAAPERPTADAVAMPAAAPSADAAAPAPTREDAGPTCTQAQLRRFIKSRPWIPMHELRRRFGIFGEDDDVSPVRVGTTTIFVGLPPAEGRMLGDLLASGDVGYELSLDPVTPIVVGVYPMRPVPRG